jgi:hypothetical protein
VDPAAGGDEGDLADTVRVIVEDLLRQTGGFREVASRSAVLDGDGQFLRCHASLLGVVSAARSSDTDNSPRFYPEPLLSSSA